MGKVYGFINFIFVCSWVFVGDVFVNVGIK